jgi:hypothetical protein
MPIQLHVHQNRSCLLPEVCSLVYVAYILMASRNFNDPLFLGRNHIYTGTWCVVDEMFYPHVDKGQVSRVLGQKIAANIPSQQIWDECMQKYHVFLVHKPNAKTETERQCMTQWQAAIGPERVLYFEDPNGDPHLPYIHDKASTYY